MKKILVLLSVFCFVASFCTAQMRATKCYCHSSFSINQYVTKIDSISLILKKEYSSNILIVGLRGWAAARVIFILGDTGQKKGFFFDLVKDSIKIVDNVNFNKLAEIILADSIIINELNTKKLSEYKYVDHDISFFFSYSSVFSKNFKEICGSVVLAVKDEPLKDNFKQIISILKEETPAAYLLK